MAVLAAVCTKVPEAKLGIIFLPMITFTAGNVSVSLCVYMRFVFVCMFVFTLLVLGVHRVCLGKKECYCPVLHTSDVK